MSLSVSFILSCFFHFCFLITLKLYSTLTFAVCLVACDERLWKLLPRFGCVVRCGMSMSTDNISGAVLCVDKANDMIDYVHISIV